MKFLGNVLATVIGLFVFCLLFFFGIIFIGAIAGGNEDTVKVEENAVIELDLSKVSLDYAGKTSYKDFNYFEADHDGVTDILNAIEVAKNDDKIGIVNIDVSTKNDDAKNDDDVLVKGEFHLIKGEPVQFKFRSRDVIHSAFMPHFRAQMNCVPGMETMFEFTPTITTAEMRTKLNNPKFNYILLCNKICGATHFNLQMDIVVDTKEEFNKWMAEQKTWAQTQSAAKQTAAANVTVTENTSAN
jgi:heme/copper-type cytochrome/quinol oxidase subunit 2